MRYTLLCWVLLCLAALAPGCATRNVGSGPVEWFFVEITSIVPSDPAGLFPCDGATFSAAVTGGTAPFNYEWNFGGAVTPNTASSPPGASTSTRQTLGDAAAPQTHTITVTATDGSGLTATDTMVISIGVTRNATPVVNSAVYDSGSRTLTVSVSDPDECDGHHYETLTVTATPSAGLAVDAASKVAAATGPLTAVFDVSATDFIAGAKGTIDVYVSDGSASSNLHDPVPVTIPAIALPADTLVALSMAQTAPTGADVQVVILTGAPAHPFQYMVGCGLTIESDATYKSLSFDVGSADPTPDVGSVNPVDGIWAAMAPGGGFLLAPDNFIQSTDIGSGRERWDFNITPLGGSNLSAESGALFNAVFTFTAPGRKVFGFQEQSGVKRTYYASDALEFFWGDIFNDGSVGPNSVIIN